MLDGHFFTFLVAISILTMVPGADTVMVTRNSMRGGFKDGFYTSLGICNGLFIHAAISIGGLSVILLNSAELFHTVKLIGAAYLCWMGVSSFRQMMKGGTVEKQLVASGGQVSIVRSLREGFLSNVLNPKPVVFYMAFLPQFIDPTGNPVLQAIVLVGIHYILAMIWQCLLAAMVQKAKEFLSSPRVRVVMDGIMGTVLIGFGLKLALDES